MYTEFYGFNQKPFVQPPAPAFLFRGRELRAAFQSLQSALRQRLRFCVITGETGTGKTALARLLRENVSDRFTVGYLRTTDAGTGAQPTWLLKAFGLAADSRPGSQFLLPLLEYVQNEHARQKRTLLIIDEAQALSVAGLETLYKVARALADQHLDFQVFLFGRKELRNTFNSPVLEPFAREIALAHHLKGLDLEQTFAYIEHRMELAGGNPHLFTRSAVEAIYLQSGGTPRVINLLCEMALVYGYMLSSATINSEMVSIVASGRRQAGLTGGMWQNAQDLLTRPPGRRATAVPHRKVDIRNPRAGQRHEAVAAHAVPATGRKMRPASTRRRRAGRVIDAISVALVLALAALAWMGRERLFTADFPLAMEQSVKSVEFGRFEGR